MRGRPGEASDRDAVHAGFGNGAQRLEADAAGSLGDARPSAMRQASRMSARLMLSSSTIFAPADGASCSSASDSTSIWMNLQPGPAAACAAAILQDAAGGDDVVS